MSQQGPKDPLLYMLHFAQPLPGVAGNPIFHFSFYWVWMTEDYPEVISCLVMIAILSEVTMHNCVVYDNLFRPRPLFLVLLIVFVIPPSLPPSLPCLRLPQLLSDWLLAAHMASLKLGTLNVGGIHSPAKRKSICIGKNQILMLYICRRPICFPLR